MQKTIIYILIIFGVTFGKCEKDDLKLERQDCSGTDLRMDGIFYNKPHKAHFFLYRNGIFFDGGTRFKGSLSDMLEFYSQNKNYTTAYELPYRWGVFKIENNEIMIEKWVSSDTFGRYTTSMLTGKIINNTTLLIDYPVKSIGRDTFYFHQFPSKPDSTNTFIN